MSVLPNTTIEISHELFCMLKGYSCVQNNEGCSPAIIFHCKKEEEEFYLKAEQSDGEIKREHDIIKWLNGRLPVPEIKYFDEYNGWSFLLMTAAKGYKTGISDSVCEPYEKTLKLVADGLLMVQNVDIADCPFIMNYDVKFQIALHNIETNYIKLFDSYKIKNTYFENYTYVDTYDLDESNKSFETSTEFYDWLLKNKPSPQEKRCFSHGDYGLPNTFIDGNAVTGFIDMGGGGIYCSKWYDIAICIRSIGYHSRNTDEMKKYVDLLFQRLAITPDWDKINYHIWLDRLAGMNNSNGNI